MIVAALDSLERKLKDPQLLDKVGSVAVSRIQKRLKTGQFKANSALTQSIKGSSKPLYDKGTLIAGITHTIKLDRTGTIIGTNHPAASILHNGGTITPKSSKFLAIPAGNRTRQLMRSYGATPRACIENMKSSGYNVWSYFGTGNPVILATKKNGQSKPFTLFILKRSVEIPARPYMILDGTDLKILREIVQEGIL